MFAQKYCLFKKHPKDGLVWRSFWKKLRKLPYEIGYLSSIWVLNLNSTQIKNMPDSFSNLLELQELDLSNTELTKVPDSIENYSKYLNLEYLLVYFSLII